MGEEQVKKNRGASAAQSRAVTPEQLEMINAYTRRKLEAEEVYVFTLILCDNEIDRDGERFPKGSLQMLGTLFLGKTGVFDHNPKAENQSARIFDTRLEVDGERRNSLGEAYVSLRAWAYMVRCEKNRDLMLEIDAGIKKEVSVGCSVTDTVCSVCRQSQKEGGCGHVKGKVYDGAVCHHLLLDPTDAYEWSFVAVPAQKLAGVTKGFEGMEKEEERVKLEKWFSQEGKEGVTVSAGQYRALREEFQSLKALARAGEEYLGELRREAVRLGLLSGKGMDPGAMESVAGKMDAGELRAFCKAFAPAAGERLPLRPQTAGPQEKRENKSNHQFKV